MHISLKYKTRPCINFTKKGFCSYGNRCHYLHIEADLEEEGKKTRSNSEESNSSKSSVSEKGNKLWHRLTHNKRIELIQTLGFDYSIRYLCSQLELRLGCCKCWSLMKMKIQTMESGCLNEFPNKNLSAIRNTLYDDSSSKLSKGTVTFKLSCFK